jgi:hypothetical protein
MIAISDPYSIIKFAEINLPDTVAALNENGEFILIQFLANNQIKKTTVIPGYPGMIGDIYSDPEKLILWLVDDDKIFFLNIKSKSTGKIIIPRDQINNFIGISSVFVKDQIGALYGVVFNYNEDGDIFSGLIIFDSVENKIIYHIWPIKGYLIPFYNDQFLFCVQDQQFIKWSIKDSNLKKEYKNNLVNELSNNYMIIPDYSNKYISNKNLIVLNNIGKYYILNWSEKIDTINSFEIKPFISKDIYIDIYNSKLSRDGNWLKLAFQDSYSNFYSDEDDSVKIAFYDLNKIRNGRFDDFIIDGISSKTNSGAFMKHKEWNNCYVEKNNKFPDKILVYKFY